MAFSWYYFVISISRSEPGGGRGDHKACFAWGLDDRSVADLLELAHVRWVIERFDQDAKGELGFDDYDGRLWPGLHRHLSLVRLSHSLLTLLKSYASEPPPGPPDDDPHSRLRRGGSLRPGRRSIAALRRLILDQLFNAVLSMLTQPRSGP